MNKKRLLKLADFLETVPRKKFDLDSWVSAMPTKPEANTEGSCGFAGCALGWAIHAKLFPGLTFEPEEEPGEINRGPKYRGHTGFRAITVLFGIRIEDAFNIFTSGVNYHTQKQVAQRIRAFVEAESIT